MRAPTVGTLRLRAQLQERTLWRLHLADSLAGASEVARVPLMTGTTFSPRLGSNYLLGVSATGSSESVWKLSDGTRTELWSAPGAQIFGAPAISPDGQKIAFPVRQHAQTFLYVIQADGANAKILTDSLELQGSPAWAPDGRSITSAVNDHGVPRAVSRADRRPPAGPFSPGVLDRSRLTADGRASGLFRTRT